MKKLLILAAVVFGFSLLSCGHSMNDNDAKDTVKVDTAMVDTAVIDTAVVDTVAIDKK